MPRLDIRSLRLRLLVALVLPLAVLTTGGVLLDYRSAQRMLSESHDRALANTAIGLAARVEADRDGDLPTHLVATMRAVSRLGEARDLAYLVTDGSGRRIAGDARLAALGHPSLTHNPSLADAVFLQQPVRVATYAYVGPEGRATIVVAEGMGQRIADAQSLLMPAALTNLAMALVMTVAAMLSVRYALAPLDVLGLRVEGHEVQALRPMQLRGLPRETRPLVRAINRLMARLRRTVKARQNFIDDTAHQLRTPLASLQTQVELLAAGPLPPPAMERVRLLQGSVHRLSHLTHQMLALARATNVSAAVTPMQTVQLPEVLAQTASACIDLAIAQGIDLGFESSPATVQGSPWMLHELLVNLVDNAIRYSPRGCVVTVRCGLQAGLPFLEVEDNGPGIAVTDRTRAMQRHVRLAGDAGHGTGLGLSIVREIAGRHQAQVTLHDGAGGSGLRVRIDFKRQL